MPDDGLVLGFDTSAAHCAAALLCGETVLLSRAEEMAKGQAERLMPLLEEMLVEAGIGWPDLRRIGVGIGPGNFTGLRISVAAARGLALALGVPAVGVSGFEAAALGRERPLTVTLPAPRGQVYLQRFGAQAAEAPELCPADLALTETAVHPGLPAEPLAVAIARIAARRSEGIAERPAPLYIRPADAAPPREAPPPILP
ncbi:tRNA (adenosine(37)-N6)-threonylcarbamoyltransferase complex dimerization subunit type 1 TsaB [Psychromarinibacter sp. C21-152]|uniref:tRNA (Adenosine(37)-N6)-threonylcarbamoyltransferase complex dimerization subunit type 1 TsaB n=1 Tax=Psychromarinibacter sediminicola TaxID=3033385 RepID=A0AAE3NVJ5_9RHOB|nr:tRNA (adenosine(37)-N6)-threonylcarbamoyltransferase complex dimerization subunit type 1 TsaB [Psychromarinibacter sediminicola]MDF0603049.1 tRNA (adenosine(37)-N6)-threonylcarbamoyltransferase complex dimerization subunit type 1 TsaB [Psychromarinibacter sediminicola]